MNHTTLTGIPLTSSTLHNGHNQKSFNKYEKSKPISSPYITTPIDSINKKRKNTEVQKQHFDDEMMKQLEEDYSNVSNYKIGKNEENYKSNHRKQKQKQNQVLSLHHYESLPVETQHIYQNLNRYPLNKRNNYGQELYFQNDQNNRNLSEQPQIHHNEPQPFRYIRQTDTIEDLDECEQEQEHQYTKTKSSKNLRALNEMMINKNSGFQESDKRNSHQRMYQMGQLQKKAILQNFRVSDLHFLNDQQLLPHNMLVQRLKNSKSIKLSGNNSGKAESNHAMFRDTIQYIDGGKFNQKFYKYNRNQQSHQMSQHSSKFSSPLTNVGEGYRGKYKKYKEKYLNMADVVKQFQMLNQTLIKDQREHFRYYEETIKNLEGLLLMKDKEIQELSHLLSHSRISQQQRNSRQLCSIEGRHLQIQNQKLKRQAQSMGKQIQSLKQNFKNLDESFQVTEKSKQSQSKSLEKKNQFLKKQKESLTKRIKPLQELIKTYEQKIKDKEERINKLSEMNSQLQEEILKLKNKLRLEDTYDTERDYRISFAPKISKNHFVQQNNQNSPTKHYPNRTSLQNSIIDTKANPYIEKYLECIDSQLQLIRSHITLKMPNLESRESRESQIKKKQVSNLLNSIDQFQVEESNKQERTQNISLNDLIDVVDKLASFRVSMGV